LAEEARWTAPYEKRFPEETRRLVGASISHLDEAVGRIIGAVDKAGLRENTLIIFTSDNGGPQRVTPSDEYEGRYKHMNGPHSDNGPLHGWKGEVYEGGILAPSLVNWPARLKPRVENTVMSAMDWLPTLAALSGFQIKEEMKLEGVNIWPILSGASRGQFRTLYWKTSDQSAVRLGDWKLVSGKKSGMELFDLSRDPYEKTNLAEREAGRLAELKAALTHEAAK
jgi:arylsulfatase A-like enzyme